MLLRVDMDALHMEVASCPIVADAVLHEQLSLHAVSINNLCCIFVIIAAIISF